MPNILNPTHGSFLSMKKRCNEPSHKDYKYYGGRGIKVCDRWKYFKNFLDDMGERPQGKTIDRINTNDGYYLENCRWATHAEQMRNRTDSIRLNGESKTWKEWSEFTGINVLTLHSRHKKQGWSVEKTLTTPIMNIGRPPKK